MNSEFRPIPGYENYYEVSSEGVVRSKLRRVIRSDGKYRTVHPHIMKIFPATSSNSTARVELNKENKYTSVYLPNLVASVFLNVPYDSMIYHKDGNKNNNVSSNLTTDIKETNIYHQGLANEEWRSVSGFEDKYQVSNLGRLRTLGNRIYHSRCNYNQRQTKIHEFSNLNQWGYISVGLWKDGKCSQRMLHRLVAEAFIPNPDNLPFVNHIDGNKRNNCVENLEWVTAKENAQHAIRTGLNPANGESKPVLCITNNTYYSSISEAQRTLGLDRGSILESINRNQPYSGYQFKLVK